MLRIKSDDQLKESSSTLVIIEGEPDEDTEIITVDFPDEDQLEQEFRPGEEGNTLIHGNIVVRSNERSALFSRNLDKLIYHIVCRLCSTVKKSLHTWREHCRSVHSDAPGFSPTLVNTSDTDESETNVVKPFACDSCDRKFGTAENLENHRSRISRVVRLICPQCLGQYGNLETHVQEEHQGCIKCGICAMETFELIAHCHTLHGGFNSVLVESVFSCFGDGISTELFESVLETSIEFLASEIKTEPKSLQLPASAPEPQASNTKPVVGVTSQGPRINFGQSVLLTPRRSLDCADITSTKDSISIESVTTADSTTIRDRKNIEDFKRYYLSGVTPDRHDCEICGFVPYTKNKYREKQDHLTKYHFKERIDALIPVARSYTCPDQICDYNAKDRQDILRHYTGKHNILKMWVEEFLRVQLLRFRSAAKEAKEKAEQPRQLSSGSGLTFQEMERMAIDKEYGMAEEILGMKTTSGSTEKTATTLSAAVSKEKQLRSLPRPKGVLEGVAHDLLSTPTTGTVTISTPSGQITLSRQKNPMTEQKKSYLLVPVVNQDGNRIFFYKCDLCDGNVVFNSNKSLQEHKAVEHGEPVELAEPDDVGVDPLAMQAVDPLSTEQFICANCNMNFPTQKALTLHCSVCKDMETNQTAASSFLPPSLLMKTTSPIVAPISKTTYLLSASKSKMTSPASESSEMKDPVPESADPPKKKARRPPPSLLPI